MTPFEKELESVVTSTDLTTVAKIEAIKQAVSTHIIGEDDAAIDVFDNYRNSLRAKQRQALGDKA